MTNSPDSIGHGFERREFEARLARAQAAMRDDELDALVVTTAPNVRYFTGFNTQFWESPTRPWFIVVPRQGAVIAVIPEIGLPGMAETWVEDIRGWPAPRPDDDGVSLLEAALAMAERAVLETERAEPTLLDTLAEVQFQLGQSEAAVATIQEAIVHQPFEPYYREQLRRFLGERDAEDRPDPPGFGPSPLPAEGEEPGISV